MMGLIILISLAMVTAMVLLNRFQRKRGTTTLLSSAMIGGPEIHELAAGTRSAAIRELSALAATVLRWPDEDTIFRKVMEREASFPTGLVHGIAVPHARFIKLGRSLVIFARSARGIPWDCIDGQPARTFFFILTPEEDDRAQLTLLREIGQCADHPDCVKTLSLATDCLSINKAVHEAIRHSRIR